MDVGGGIAQPRIALEIEDDAGAVGEHHHGAGLRQQLAGRGHHRLARLQQVPAVVPQGVQRILAHGRRRLGALGIDRIVEAAPPGIVDEPAQGIGIELIPAEELLPRGHHLVVILGDREFLSGLSERHLFSSPGGSSSRPVCRPVQICCLHRFGRTSLFSDPVRRPCPPLERPPREQPCS